MSTWTNDELRRIADAAELEIAPVRRNGELRRATPIWVVRAGDELYVRAAYGANTGWHGVARSSHRARIARAASNATSPSRTPTAGSSTPSTPPNREKYGRHYAQIVDSITDDEHRATTLRLLPQHAA
jgi:hypothetical protein